MPTLNITRLNTSYTKFKIESCNIRIHEKIKINFTEAKNKKRYTNIISKMVRWK